MEDFSKEFFLTAMQARSLFLRLRPAENVTYPECYLLSLLKGQQREGREPLQPSEISRALHLPKPAISKMLGSLEEKNYIKRMSDQKDRRIVYVRLTELGDTAWTNVHTSFRQFYQRVFENMGEAESREMLRLVRKFCSTIETVGTDREQLK